MVQASLKVKQVSMEFYFISNFLEQRLFDSLLLLGYIWAEFSAWEYWLLWLFQIIK